MTTKEEIENLLDIEPQIDLNEETIELLARGRRCEIGIGFITKQVEILTDGEEPMGTGKFKTVFEPLWFSLSPIRAEKKCCCCQNCGA